MFSQQVMRVHQQGDRGAVLVEYAMLLVFIAIVAVATLAAFGVTVLELYSDNAERYAGAVQGHIGK